MITNNYDSIEKLPLKPDKFIDESGEGFSTNNSTYVTNIISQSTHHNNYTGGGGHRDASLTNNSTDITSNKGIDPFNAGFNDLLGTIDKENGLSGFDTKNVTEIIGETKQISNFDNNEKIE